MWLLIGFIICQRLIELRIAKRNEQWMMQRGGVQLGGEHYKWFILLHIIFFLSVIVETGLQTSHSSSVNLLLLFVFIIAQVGRVWCITALGRFWNTKIIVLPRVALIKKGPYKFVKHPNYIIVAIELFVIPMLFSAYFTAIMFPLLHWCLLKIRIPHEEKALAIKS